MGMTIDEFDEYAKAHDCVIFTRQQYEHVIDVFNDYELLLFDYYGRLKVDMVAMLTELSMTIGEIEDGYTDFDEENKRSLTMIPLESVDRLIQQKINELKGEQE